MSIDEQSLGSPPPRPGLMVDLSKPDPKARYQGYASSGRSPLRIFSPLLCHADSPIRRFADSPIRRFADSPIRRFADSPIRRFADSLVRWFADSLVRWFADSRRLRTMAPGGPRARPVMHFSQIRWGVTHRQTDRHTDRRTRAAIGGLTANRLKFALLKSLRPSTSPPWASLTTRERGGAKNNVPRHLSCHVVSSSSSWQPLPFFPSPSVTIGTDTRASARTRPWVWCVGVH